MEMVAVIQSRQVVGFQLKATVSCKSVSLREQEHR